METFLATKKNKVSQNLFNPKTINARYVQNVLKSELFLRDFNVYLKKDFISDYSMSREFKIGKLIEKCQDMLVKQKLGFDAIKDYVENNPKCKLPWTNQELYAAQLSVNELIDIRIEDKRIVKN